MTKSCKNLVNAYIEWLRQNISIKEINGMYEITTPFLDRHNDHLQIYVKKSDGGLILTDNGQTITNLRLSGFEFTPEKRQILNSNLKSFGIQLIDEELVAKTTPEDFPQKKHNLIQAILYISSCNIL
jgi:predicted RNA-binding protein YlqC (UPF0109 family)